MIGKRRPMAVDQNEKIYVFMTADERENPAMGNLKVEAKNNNSNELWMCFRRDLDFFSQRIRKGEIRCKSREYVGGKQRKLFP